MALRRKLVLVLSGVALVMGSFQVVSAHEFSSKSGVSITVTSKGFKGSVTSGNDDCLDGRKVTLYKQKKSGDKKIDSIETNEDGKWSLRVDDAQGKYYAEVARSIETRYLHVHECKGATSPSEKV